MRRPAAPEGLAGPAPEPEKTLTKCEACSLTLLMASATLNSLAVPRQLSTAAVRGVQMASTHSSSAR